MKNLLILVSLFTTTASLSLMAAPFSINPNYVEHHQFKSLGDKTPDSNGEVRAYGVKYNDSTEEYTDNGRRFNVPYTVYQRAKKLSQSVFKASPSDGMHGTAFYVGGRLILTNQHVLSPSRRNTTECKNFNISLHSNQRQKTLYCKKVHYCSKNLDFCLIEMKDHRRGQSLTKEVALKLTRDSDYSPLKRTMVIGNPMGYGIHASTGIGTIPVGRVNPWLTRFKFFAPLFGGNSGGPILNDDNKVIGIAQAQSRVLESTRSYNIGVPMQLILNVLEEKLANTPEVLDQLNIVD